MNNTIQKIVTLTTISAGLVFSMGASAYSRAYCNGHRCYSERQALRHYNYKKKKAIASGERRATEAMLNGHPRQAAKILKRTDKKVRRIDRHKRFVRHHSF